MKLKHYLDYLQNTIVNRWDALAMKDLDGNTSYTYGEIANIIAKEKGIKKMSAQAVGQAVGFNPICIIIPCHRVMGAGGKITGYGGGIKNKVALLKLEGNF